jgi:PAS domain S-box-containing protein
LYETNLDAVLQTAIGGNVLAANPAACAMFGTDEAGILGLGRRGLVSATDTRFDELIARRQAAGHANGVVAMMRADGTPFEAEAASVMYADDGETYCSWVLHDVTERRVAEAAVAARIAAEDANRAKTEFIAHMSHELRTPLNAILGFSAVLQLDQRRALHPAHLQQVGHIRNAGTHLLAMISDLLDLSSMENGSVRLSVEPIEPWQLAMQAIRDLSARAEAAEVQVEIWPPLPTIGRMLGDATRFSQIVLNLLSNAIKYNRPGGRAQVRLSVAEGRLVLVFRDSGCGMSRAQLEALFQPFNRLGREGSNIEGTGIGLVITKRLVEAMGGTLSVRSELDDGSEFEVDLPFDRPIAERSPPSGPRTDRVGASDGTAGAVCRVLYIDDDPINRLLVKALLEMRGDVRLHLASNGADGVAAATELQPELVLSDMRMAGMNGIDVVRALRAQPALEGARIVAVSASAMPGEIERALAAGFDQYLTKPVVAEQLFQEVDRTLARLSHASTGS